MFRTDLALEAKEMYHQTTGTVTEIEGVKAETVEENGILITTVDVLNEHGKKALHKEIGRYITLELPNFKEYGNAYYQTGSAVLKKALCTLLPKVKRPNVLVVGLGNRNITPDALGGKVTDKLIVTRHLEELAPKAIADLGLVSCIAPGVMGVTGMETADIISHILPAVQPDAVIAIDALAACNMERLGCTIQLSDTGISPGSGIGNCRAALNQAHLGIPVIALGVPLVVDAATLTYSALNHLHIPLEFAELENVLTEKEENLIVTPKDIDRMIIHASDLVAAGINLALHPITLEQIPDYVG